MTSFPREWYEANLPYWNGEMGTIPGTNQAYTPGLAEQLVLGELRPELQNQITNQVVGSVAIDTYQSAAVLGGLAMTGGLGEALKMLKEEALDDSGMPMVGRTETRRLSEIGNPEEYYQQLKARVEGEGVTVTEVPDDEAFNILAGGTSANGIYWHLEGQPGDLYIRGTASISEKITALTHDVKHYEFDRSIGFPGKGLTPLQKAISEYNAYRASLAVADEDSFSYVNNLAGCAYWRREAMRLKNR
jgi:hypothetical protein